MNDEKSRSLVLNIHDILGGDADSSVKLSQTTKGVTWEIKVYNKDAEKALELADQLFDRCRKRYGRGLDK